MADLHSEAADALFQAILSLRSEEECYAFFEDLYSCTDRWSQWKTTVQ